MTEVEKVAYAKSFIDRLANGINPLDGSQIPPGDIVNNVRLSRCFFYVSDILRQVIEAGGTVSRRPKSRGKAPFSLSPEQLEAYQFTQFPIPISEVAKRLNNLNEDEGMKRLTHRQLTGWLVGIGALREFEGEDGKLRREPTDVGAGLGITVEDRHGQYGDYRVVLYSREAQAFIVDNLTAFLERDGGDGA